MKHHQRPHSLVPCLLILIAITLQYSTSASARNVDDGVEFSYIEGSKKGPSRWGELKKDWAACKNGRIQSPIDLSSNKVKVVSESIDLNKSYKRQNATLLNIGRGISVRWDGDAGSIQVNGTHFFLQETHWHWPSEHTINGRRYDLELHMVHGVTRPDGKNETAVVAVLYEFDRPDPFISKLEKYIKEIGEVGEERSLGVMDPSEIKLGGNTFYRYIGSLTAPPCTEGVIWSINKEIQTVSKEQVKLLSNTVPYYARRNARPLQPLNKREIQLYVPNANNKHHY